MMVAMVAPDLRYGTRVKITGVKDNAVGQIERIWPVDAVQFVGGFDWISSDPRATMEFLKAEGVTRVATISYRITRYSEAMFTAVEIGGAWFDLQKNPITLEVVGQYAGY